MSTKACGTPAIAPSSVSKRADADAAADGWPAVKSRSRYSSGPIQSVARVEWALARQASSENATPQTGWAAARASASPWNANRVAGGRPVSHSREGRRGTRRCACSTIDSRSGRIVENRRGHFDFEVAAGHGDVERLAHAGAAPGDQGQRDRISQHAAGIRGGHVPDQFHGRALARFGGDLRAFFEHGSGVAGAQSDELFAVRRLHRGALQGALADEVCLVLAD